MKLVKSIALVSLLAMALSSCGTLNGVRWAYGQPSAYDDPDDFSEEEALRATIGIPVIVGGVCFDAVTFPVQALFGVWPWWGEASTMMKPDTAQ